MTQCENNITPTRADERRSLLLPLALLVAGAILFAVGFFAVPWRKGKPDTEYEFNRAVVTNKLPDLNGGSSKMGQDGKTAKPSKGDKKNDDFCPT